MYSHHVAPLTFTTREGPCGYGGAVGSGITAPLQYDVAGPKDELVEMLHGDVATLGGLDDGEYGVALYRAENGDLDSYHYSNWIDFMVHQLP